MKPFRPVVLNFLTLESLSGLRTTVGRVCVKNSNKKIPDDIKFFFNRPSPLSVMWIHNNPSLDLLGSMDPKLGTIIFDRREPELVITYI